MVHNKESTICSPASLTSLRSNVMLRWMWYSHYIDVAIYIYIYIKSDSLHFQAAISLTISYIHFSSSLLFLFRFCYRYHRSHLHNIVLATIIAVSTVINFIFLVRMIMIVTDILSSSLLFWHQTLLVWNQWSRFASHLHKNLIYYLMPRRLCVFCSAAVHVTAVTPHQCIWIT